MTDKANRVIRCLALALVPIFSLDAQVALKSVKTVKGTVQGARFGFSLAGPGDVNKDGVPDIVVSAPGESSNTGAVYVLSGKDAKLLQTFKGSAKNDQFGECVGGAGDVDGDGHADIIVGAIQAAGRGYAQVLSGKNGKVLHAFVGDGAGSWFGRAVDSAGDVDKDGYPDVIVGAPRDATKGSSAGMARILSGKTGKAIHTFYGSAISERFGRSVSGAGDVNGDGHADVIVGAWHAVVQGQDVGSAFVYCGKDGRQIYRFDGDRIQGFFGRSVDGVGDVDGDRVPDLGVGGHGGKGSAHIYSGKTGKQIHRFDGSSNGFGLQVRGIGDLDLDGHGDIAVSAYLDAKNGAESGKLTVFSGKTGREIVSLTGDKAGDWFGYTIAAIGDTDGDGIPEFAAGAPFSAATSTDAGLVKIVSMVKPPIATFQVFGTGCAGAKTSSPSLRSTAPPVLGRVFVMELEQLSYPSGGMVVIGLSDKAWGSTPLPLNLAFMGMPKCNLLVSWDASMPVFAIAQSLSLKLPVPSKTNLLGAEFFVQLWMHDSSANAAGIAVSNGGKGVIGR